MMEIDGSRPIVTGVGAGVKSGGSGSGSSYELCRF